MDCLSVDCWSWVLHVYGPGLSDCGLKKLREVAGQSELMCGHLEMRLMEKGDCGWSDKRGGTPRSLGVALCVGRPRSKRYFATRQARHPLRAAF